MHGYIVTGAARGLGRALVERLLTAPQTRVVGLVRDLGAAGPGERAGLRHIAADLAQPPDAERLIAEALAALGPGPFASLTLINNAGVVAPIAQAGHYPAQAVVDAFNINLLAPVLLSNAFLAATATFTGSVRLLNISSGAAAKAYPGWGVYGASKAGLDHFSRHAALEQGAHGARVVALYPGVVDTGMQANIRQASEQDFPLRQRFDTLKADGALTLPDETARQILRYLHSDAFGSEAVVDIRNLTPTSD